jgi:MoaA/NifB/PqqE/SkfB family radical SAM enzyme
MRILTLGVTSRCLQKCRHCHYSCSSDGVHLDPALAKKILEEARALDFSYLRLTGGEPFLYPHLEDILHHATLLGYTIEIETGDSEFSKNCAMLKPYNIVFIAFSLSGAYKGTHDFIRGHGSFEKTMSNIERAHRGHYRVRIAYIIDNLNIGELSNAIALVNRMNASWTTLNEVLSVGRAIENRLIMTPDLLPFHVPYIGEKLPAGKFKFSSNYTDGHCNFIKGGNCFVNWDGEITLCSYAGFEEKIADLKTMSFVEGFRNLSVFTLGMAEKALEIGKRINCATCTLEYHDRSRRDDEISSKIAVEADWAMIGSIKIPKALNVLLTRQCNFSCDFCEFACTTAGPSLDIDILERLLAEGKALGIREVIYDGGEPLLYQYFEESLRLASHFGYAITVLTNGWFFKDYLPLMKKYSVMRVIFGIDGATAMTNDRIKKKKGAWARVVEAVRLSKEQMFNTGLHFVLTARNYLELDEFLLLARRMAVDYVMISKLIPLGRAHNAPDLRLSADQEDMVRGIYEKHASFLSTITFIGAYAKGSELRRANLCYYLNMAEHLAVDWNGRIPLCALAPMLDLPFPSLGENSLLECLIRLCEINRRFRQARESEFLSWKPGTKYIFCEYCIDRLSETPQPFFEGNRALCATTAGQEPPPHES